MKNYAISGACVGFGIVLLKGLFQIGPRDLSWWEHILASIILAGTVGAGFGAIVGAITGYFLIREDRRRWAQEKSRTDSPLPR